MPDLQSALAAALADLPPDSTLAEVARTAIRTVRDHDAASRVVPIRPLSPGWEDERKMTNHMPNGR